MIYRYFIQYEAYVHNSCGTTITTTKGWHIVDYHTKITGGDDLNRIEAHILSWLNKDNPVGKWYDKCIIMSYQKMTKWPAFIDNSFDC